MKNQLKAGAVLSYVSLLAGNVVGLLYTPFLLSSLGQSQYGLFTLANSIVGYLTVLDFGFQSATIRYTAKYRADNEMNKAQELYGMFLVLYLIIGFLTFLLGAILSSLSSNIFTKGLTVSEVDTVKTLILLASINLAVSFPFGVFTSIINAYEKFVFLKISSLIRLLVNPIVFIPVLLFGYKSIGLIVVSTVINLVFLSINVWYCIVKLHIKIVISKFNFSLLKEITSYSVWIFVGSVVSQLWWNSGQFLLGVYSSSAAIAIYGLAIQFKNYFESFATAITNVFLPKMTTMVSEGLSNSNFSDYFIKVGRLQYIVISLITTGFVLFGKQFIITWAGSEYVQSFYVTILIFIPLSLVDTQTLGITILQAKNKHKFRSLLYLVIVTLCIAFTIPFIKYLGVYGCAGATSLALIIGNIFIMNWYYWKKIGLDIKQYWIEILKMTPGVLVISGVAYITLKIVPALTRYRTLLPAMGIYCVLYLFVLYFISMNDYERKMIKSLICKLSIRKQEGIQ